ncbi:MAG: MMPL family transporter [Acidobacteria bacterium]|nr:MMPL family transporter [Acidobacteriota bacterium]
MEQFWRNSGVQLGKHWKLVFVVIAAITVILGFGARNLNFATGQESYLNSDSQVALDNVEFQDQFGGETVILMFTADEGHTIADLFVGENLETLESLTDDLRSVELADSVLTPLVTLSYSDSLIKGPARSSLLAAVSRDPDPAGQAARSADVEISLARLAEVTDQEIGNPDWNEVLLYGNDEFSMVDGVLDPPADEDREIRLSLASIFPNDEVAVGGVVMAGNASLDDLSASTDQLLEITKDVTFDGFEMVVTGSPIYLQEINNYLQGGMITLGLAAMAIMALILILLFQVRWRLLPLAAVVFGIAWGFSIMGFLGIDLSLVTISGLPILIGLGIDFAIQIHNRVEEEVVLDRAEHPIADSMANMVPPLIVAVVGSVLAFLALRISQVPMIRDFGVLLAIGVTALLITGVVIPAASLGIREWTTPTTERKTSLVEHIVVRLGSLPSKLGLPLVILAVILFGIGVAVEGDAEIESDPIRWIDQSSQTVTDIELLTEETGFASTLGILVQANNVIVDEINEMLWEFTLDTEERPEVVSSSSLVNTMGKIIMIPDGTPLAPTSADIAGSLEVMPDDIKAALIKDDLTSTQVNLRLIEASLEERAVLVEEIEADLEARIDALELDEDSILLINIAEGSEPVRAVPSGLAVVGTGLLENLSANRALLTYLGLAIVAAWLILRHRSLSRALLSMVPVTLAVGVSAIIVAVFEITLSPLTTVGGPLVIASCTEFSVLILARYLEERQRGLEPRAASDLAAARTGRAFFTSAATTIGGFAVLIGSALPLLRDFGIIVTINVAVALLAALVVMPPLVVWADHKNLLGIEERNSSVRLAARSKGQLISAVIGFVVVAAIGVALLASAETGEGTTAHAAYNPEPLPTTTMAPATEGPAPADPADFGSDAPTEGLIAPLLFGFMTESGASPQEANCTLETMYTFTDEEALLAGGIAEFGDESVQPVVESALACGVSQEVIDATIESARS